MPNKSAIELSKHPSFNRSTKHIEVKFHFIWEKIEEGEIVIKYVSSKDQLADILTKSLPRVTFKGLKDKLSIL